MNNTAEKIDDQEIDQNNEPLFPDFMAVYSHVDFDKTMDKIAELDKEADRLKLYQSQVSVMVKDSMEGINRSRTMYANALKAYVLGMGEKSLKTVTGELKTRTTTKDIYPEGDLVQWAKDNGLEECIEKETIEKFSKKKFKEYFKRTGDIPEGFDFTEETDVTATPKAH